MLINDYIKHCSAVEKIVRVDYNGGLAKENSPVYIVKLDGTPLQFESEMLGYEDHDDYAILYNCPEGADIVQVINMKRDLIVFCNDNGIELSEISGKMYDVMREIRDDRMLVDYTKYMSMSFDEISDMVKSAHVGGVIEME